MTRPRRYNQSALAVLRRSSAYRTLSEMAAQIGIKNPSAMQRIESGHAEASEEKLRLLAKALRLPYPRVRQAYLAGRRSYLRSEADRVDRELRELVAKAS